MQITKEALQNIVNHLPAKVDIDTLFEELLLVAKLEESKNQIKNGEFLTDEELDQEIKSW